MRLILLLLISVIQLSVQKSTPADSSYVAAVVEYEVKSDTDTNVANYLSLIKDAATQNADIVVFPEMTLNRGQSRSIAVPINGLLKEYPVPALNADLYNEILVSLSKAARENQIYVVVNIQEVLNCETDAPGEECPEKKIYYFNTNVVLDRQGAVIDRYRKINLFGEFTRTPALSPELGVFDTDFGVKFGHFICFDLMFQVPAVQTPQKLNVTDVIFTTMWFSEMPYLTAVQIQQGYAYSMDVNFLAAGANNVRVGSAGSGIYSGKAGALVSIMPGVPTTRLLVSKVPKVPGQVTGSVPGPIYDERSAHDNLYLKTDPSLLAHMNKEIKPGFQDFTLITGDTLCRFKVNLTKTADSNLTYRAFIQDGYNMYVFRHLRVAACGIVACAGAGLYTCPYKFNKEDISMEFQELSIDMKSHPLRRNTTLKCDDVEYYGTSFTNTKFPLAPTNYTFSKIDTDSKLKTEYNYSLKSPQNNIVTVAIWSRIYNEDKSFVHESTKEDVQKYIEIENDIFGLSNL